MNPVHGSYSTILLVDLPFGLVFAVAGIQYRPECRIAGRRQTAVAAASAAGVTAVDQTAPDRYPEIAVDLSRRRIRTAGRRSGLVVCRTLFGPYLKILQQN